MAGIAGGVAELIIAGCRCRKIGTGQPVWCTWTTFYGYCQQRRDPHVTLPLKKTS